MGKYYLTRDELYHHGIKGQHWGQRRWQNEDGSLTPAGREHYGYGSVKGAAYRIASKIYGLNERTYSKMGNKTLSSMNKAAKEDMLKKASNADKAAQEYKNSDEYKARQEKIKKAAKIGAAATATALVAYGAYKIGSNMAKQKKWDKAKEYGQQYYNNLAIKNLRKMDYDSTVLNREYSVAKRIYGNVGNVPTNTATYRNIEKAETNYMNSYRAATGAFSRAGHYGSDHAASLASAMKQNNKKRRK